MNIIEQDITVKSVEEQRYVVIIYIKDNVKIAKDTLYVNIIRLEEYVRTVAVQEYASLKMHHIILIVDQLEIEN